MNYWNSNFRIKLDAAKNSLGLRSRKRRSARSTLRVAGKKAKLRESINRPNRARFRELGLLDVCEAKLPMCWPNGRKTWAHGKKDRKLTMDERKNLVIRCCTVCHHYLDEQMSADEMLEFVQDVIKRREKGNGSSMSEWLDSLKSGDSVIYCSGTYGKGVGKVARVTPTQIILEGGGKYRRKDGDAVGGGGWVPQYITQPTDALLLEIRKKFLCDNLRKIVWEKISVGVLADIYDKAKNGQHLKPDISTQVTRDTRDNNDP